MKVQQCSVSDNSMRCFLHQFGRCRLRSSVYGPVMPSWHHSSLIDCLCFIQELACSFCYRYWLSTNIHLSIQTKTLVPIHRDTLNTIHYTHVSEHHTRTPWTAPKSTKWWDWRPKCIYPVSGHIHTLQPGWVIRCEHWDRGPTGLIPYVTNCCKVYLKYY